jgi:hypothetical protein
MPRKTRIEIEGGLYHVITRGNGRQDIFHSREDHDKFIQLLIAQKHKLPFYLYAYCLMTNHLHRRRAGKLSFPRNAQRKRAAAPRTAGGAAAFVL